MVNSGGVKVKVKQWGKLFSGFSRRSGTTRFSFPMNKNNNKNKSTRNGVEALKFASSAIGVNRGVADISEAQTSPRFYSWPDNKVQLFFFFFLI